MKRVALAHGLIYLLTFAAFAHADSTDDPQEKAQARQLLSQGNALYETGDYRGALADFRAAYALFPSRKLLYAAASAEGKLGETVGAANDLRRFLDDPPEDEPAMVEKARGELSSYEKKLAMISLSGWPAHSVLEVDGHAAHDHFYVRPSSHQLKVTAPTGEVLDQTIEPSAGELVVVAMPATIVAAPKIEVQSTPKAEAPRKRPLWVIGLVAGVVAAGVIVTVAVVYGTPNQANLGTVPFSAFH